LAIDFWSAAKYEMHHQSLNLLFLFMKDLNNSVVCKSQIIQGFKNDFFGA
jgi:hypothetical protein